MSLARNDENKIHEILNNIIEDVRNKFKGSETLSKLEFFKVHLLKFLAEYPLLFKHFDIHKELTILANLIVNNKNVEDVLRLIDSWAKEKIDILAEMAEEDITDALKTNDVSNTRFGSVRDFSSALYHVIKKNYEGPKEVELQSPLDAKDKEKFEHKLADVIQHLLSNCGRKQTKFLIAIRDEEKHWCLLRLNVKNNQLKNVLIWDPVKTKSNNDILPIYDSIQRVIDQQNSPNLEIKIKFEKKCDLIHSMDFVIKRVLRYIPVDDYLYKNDSNRLYTIARDLESASSIRIQVGYLIRCNDLSFRSKSTKNVFDSTPIDTLNPRNNKPDLTNVIIPASFFKWPDDRKIKPGIKAKERYHFKADTCVILRK